MRWYRGRGGADGTAGPAAGAGPAAEGERLREMAPGQRERGAERPREGTAPPTGPGGRMGERAELGGGFGGSSGGSGIQTNFWKVLGCPGSLWNSTGVSERGSESPGSVLASLGAARGASG